VPGLVPRPRSLPMKAEWRPFGSRYEVSSHGRVRSLRSRSLLRQQPNHGGYMQVKLICDDGKRRWLKVHVLVLTLFVGPRPSPRHVGAHAPDRRKQNNRLENLRWALPEDNEADKRAHGTARNGAVRKLQVAHVDDIRHRAANGESYTRIAKTHGIHRHSVSRIVRGQRRAS
jgi:hypothetical protein